MSKCGFVLLMLWLLITPGTALSQQQHSIARYWNEQLLAAIRLDQARPTVHARNLFHLSVAMWDAWAAYDQQAKQMLHQERAQGAASARDQTVSYAAYRLLKWRFRRSPNIAQTDTALDRKMTELGYDTAFLQTQGSDPRALGNRIAQSVIRYGLSDGANEENDYANQIYRPVNDPLDPVRTGSQGLKNPNRWQPLHIPNFVGQSGLRGDGYPAFVGPEWGQVKPFSLTAEDVTLHQRDGKPYPVYLDPGPPPQLSTEALTSQLYKSGFEQVIQWSSELDPKNGKLLDISPASRGNNTLGTNDGDGHPQNPATGLPYDPLLVPAGDYFRVLAEFWADGPSSETPPGHWFTILNVVSDQPSFTTQFAGKGENLDPLEWDVKAYLALGGAMHDVAIAAWSIKGWYDYPRPISAIRYLCDQGQSTDPSLPRYHNNGINLNPGVIELITPESVATGQRHHHLGHDNINQIAVFAWRGPSYVKDPNEDIARSGWILCGDWWPYQRPNFVTPPFAGYVSGHSTYSRAAAEVMTLVTGSKFFPGGLGIFSIPRNRYLVFEKGPSQTMQLQWATYQDAADECSLSRIYGGIHPTADDIPGRLIGFEIGHRAFKKAQQLF